MATPAACFGDPPEVADLVATLKSVTGWYSIGVGLDIPTYELDDIKTTCKGHVAQKEKMFSIWLERLREEGIKPTWQTYLDVLEKLKVVKAIQVVKQRYMPGDPEGLVREPALPKLGSRPTRKHLQCLTGANNEKCRIIQSVAHRWENVAYQLELPPGVVKAVDKDFNDSEEKCAIVFDKWLGGGYLRPVSWETLLVVLSDLQFSELVIDLQKTFAISL